MTIDLNVDEGELLIAVLMFADMCAHGDEPMGRAIADLRPFRTRLLQGHMRDRFGVIRTDGRDSNDSAFTAERTPR